MPHEMNQFIKSFSSTLLKNTPGFEINFTISDLASVLFLTVIKDNLCLLRLVYTCNCRMEFKVVQKLVPVFYINDPICDNYIEGIQYTEILFP